MKKYTLLLLVLASLSACKNDREPVYSVPVELENYIDAFEADAAANGTTLNIDDLILEYGSELVLDGTEAAGLCHYETDETGPRIELDTATLNWTLHDFSREALVYHELGHCILDRSHDNALLPNRNYKSLMKSSGEISYSGFNQFKRDYYIAELFNPNTPTPDWAKVIEFSDVSISQLENIFIEDFDDNSNSWSIPSQANYNFKIEDGVYKLNVENDDPKYVALPINIDTNRDFEINTSISIIEGQNIVSGLIWGSREEPSSGAKLNYFAFNSLKDALIINTVSNDFVSGVFSPIESSGQNKLTIRKQGDFMYFFINEVYHEIINFQEFHGNLFGFLIPGNTKLEVEYLNLYYIN